MTNTTESKRFETDFGGRKLIVEVDKFAQQANGSCTVTYGETVVLATAVMNKQPKEEMNYFPLMVEFQDKMYATGKIKGSRFIKREGRPTDNAVLDGRMIDRGLRPLFNQEIKNDVQIILTPLSVDGDSPTEVVGVIASSVALHISDIPWNGPLAGICVSKINGEFIINIGDDKRAESVLNLVLSCAKDKIVMIDGDAKEANEDLIQQAFAFGVKECVPIIDFIETIRKEAGKEKKDVKELIDLTMQRGEISIESKKEAFEEAKKFFAPQIDKYLFNKPKGTKRERKAIAEELLNMLIENLEQKETHKEIINYIKNNFESYLEEEVAQAILEKELRIDGRKLDEIRHLSIEVGLLPRTHGTGLFQRGETQVLSILTLGAPGDVQLLDEMEEDDTQKRYMHHYCSPPFSFGEAAPIRGVGRREIGHGNLAEKALLPVLPSKEEFPYTIRVVSEVMGSNGSSSMASVCGSTLALMDAGVPIKKSVAGIAMGLVSSGDKYKILTDLQDFEDGEGGMDFKIAGTCDGVTAIQMDTKTAGLNLEICQKTLAQSKIARLKILDEMAKVISGPRADTSKYAPKIITLHINPDKIRELIGPGGKVINKIIDETGVAIDIEQDGTVFVTGAEKDKTNKALEMIDNICHDIKAGEKFTGKVSRIVDFGAFVEVLPSQEGLVHVSEFAPWRIDNVADLVKVGDEVPVVVKEIDSQGRINLSIKEINPVFFQRPFNAQPRLENRRFNNNRENRGGRGRDNRHPQRGMH